MEPRDIVAGFKKDLAEMKKDVKPNDTIPQETFFFMMDVFEKSLESLVTKLEECQNNKENEDGRNS